MLCVVSHYFQLGLLQSFNECTEEILFTIVLKNLERFFFLLLMDPDIISPMGHKFYCETNVQVNDKIMMCLKKSLCLRNIK